MYNVVLQSALNVLLVRQELFPDKLQAENFIREHLSAFPFEVWPRDAVSRWEGTTITIPLKEISHAAE